MTPTILTDSNKYVEDSSEPQYQRKRVKNSEALNAPQRKRIKDSETLKSPQRKHIMKSASISDESEVAKILTNLKDSRKPFEQLLLNESMYKKHVFMTSIMAQFIDIHDDFLIPFENAANSFITRLRMMATSLSTFDFDFSKLKEIDNRMFFIYEGDIKIIVDESPFPEYFQKKLIQTEKVGDVSSTSKYISFMDLKDLFRTHVYDSTISGIHNQEASPFDKTVGMNRYLCSFLDVPSNTKMTRRAVFDKINKYIDEHHLTNPANPNEVQVNKELSKIFTNCEKIQRKNIYLYLRQYFILEGTTHEIINTSDKNNDLYISQECYVNSQKKLHGWIRKFHPDGSIMDETFCKNGVRNGLSKSWYSNGKLCSSSIYINGNPSGTSVYLNKENQLIMKTEFIFGKTIRTRINY